MAVNIWKSYMRTAVKETNIELILAVMNTTELVVEIGPEKKKSNFSVLHDRKKRLVVPYSFCFV